MLSYCLPKYPIKIPFADPADAHFIGHFYNFLHILPVADESQNSTSHKQLYVWAIMVKMGDHGENSTLPLECTR